ncbi:helix-turn-helix domain-containing protein [Paraconexibacter sp. AEG42_29]|uniref:ArsR/SmtB family transcription factor n=1 Tax=Paraconexibacter sp. AEG42_29 TaxID=2997339 RepID=UPI00339D9A3C
MAAALESVQARLDAIERGAAPHDAPPARTVDPAGGKWWLLDRLDEQRIAYGGRVGVAEGDVVWQLEHPAGDVLEGDLGRAANVLGAMGHPLRLEILKHLLQGARTLGDLQEIPGLGTTGQLNHHLRELRGAGLVESRRRNDYAVPADRVVPLLTMIAAALGRELT